MSQSVGSAINRVRGNGIFDVTRNSISKRLIARLTQTETARLADERQREIASEGIENIYRDRRDARDPFARMKAGQTRKLYVALGIFLGLAVHLRLGINQLFSIIFFCGLALFIYEVRVRKKRERDKYFD